MSQGQGLNKESGLALLTRLAGSATPSFKDGDPETRETLEGRRQGSSLARLVGRARTCGACHPQVESGTAGAGAGENPIQLPLCPVLGAFPAPG